MRSLRSLLTALALSGAVLALPSPAPAAAPTQTKIIGGTPAGDAQFPYQARLSIRRGASAALCGAVIRDATHVMTAAHCVADVGTGAVAAATDVTVYYGSADRARQRSVTAWDVRPAARYVAGDSSWDAALITLSSPLVGYGGPTVNGIALASVTESALAVNAGATGTVSGWGLTELDALPATLRGTGVALQRDTVCSQTYSASDFVPARFVCAGGTGQAQTGNADSCRGDSGGPLVATVPSGVRLIGLVSFGPEGGCGRAGMPAAYTEVSDPSIAALLTGATAEAPPAAGAVPNAGSALAQGDPGNAAVAAPAAGAARTAAAPVRPSARLAGIRCARGRCTIHVKSNGAALTARISRRVRRCSARRVCRTSWKHVATRSVRRTRDGFTVTARLRPGRYRLSVVASNASGARSATVRREFRVPR